MSRAKLKKIRIKFNFEMNLIKPDNSQQFETIISPDWKYQIYSKNGVFYMKELPRLNVKNKEGFWKYREEIKKISVPFNSRNCVFIRYDFILFDGHPKAIFDIETGVLIDWLGVNRKIHKYDEGKEMFLISTKPELDCPYGTFHINNFLIFKLWSLSCLLMDNYLLSSDLISIIYDFGKPFGNYNLYKASSNFLDDFIGRYFRN